MQSDKSSRCMMVICAVVCIVQVMERNILLDTIIRKIYFWFAVLDLYSPRV
jgi:hypothetical protein